MKSTIFEEIDLESVDDYVTTNIPLTKSQNPSQRRVESQDHGLCAAGSNHPNGASAATELDNHRRK